SLLAGVLWLKERPVSLRLLTVVSTSATVKFTGPIGVSIVVNWSDMSTIVGGSFTGVSVRRSVSLALRRPSLTVTVIVAVPLWFAAGVTEIVRLAALPPRTR